EEVSRSKMSEKAKDLEVINKDISHKPIDYEKLNRLTEDFGKRFTPQQELSAEQAFWLRMSDPTSKPSDALPVKIEALKELPKISLVNEILKKLKFHLAKFDNVQIYRDGKRNKSCDKCFNLEAELLKSQNAFNDLLKRYSQLEKHCISLECSIQLNQDIFQKRESCDNQNALEILEFFEKNDLKAQLQDKDSTICKLKDMIKSKREKSKDENVKYDYCEIETKNIELENSVAKLISENERLCNEINHVKQLDLEPLAPRLLQNRDVHIKYLKYAQEQANSLRGIVEQAKAKQPLDKELDFTCKHAQRIQELLVYVQDTCPNAINLSAKIVVVTPKNKVKKVRIEVITSANVVPLKKTTSYLVETQSPELKVYSRKSKNVKNVGSSKKAKIVESKNANHSEPNHTWGSKATDIPLSSSLIMTGCPDCSLVSGLRMFKTHDRESLLAHELSLFPAPEDFSSQFPEQTTVETVMNMTPENKAHFESEKEAIHYQECWEAIESYNKVAPVSTTSRETVVLTARNLVIMLQECRQQKGVLKTPRSQGKRCCCGKTSLKKGVQIQRSKSDWLAAR
ncbi:hypothetical protein Tco_1112537, partial [Tanacetum coccineum]